MRPDLIQFMQMQQNQKDQSMQPQGPIGAGSMAGIEAAKQSLSMNDDERRRALGKSMMAFFSNMGKTGHGPGIEGALGAINSSFMPAANAYSQEEENIMNMNAALINQQKMQQRQAMLDEFMKQKHKDNISIKKQQLDIMRNRQSGKSKKIDPLSAVTDGSKYIPITSVAQLNRYSKDKNHAARLLDNIKEINNHLNKYSNLAKEDLLRQDAPYTGPIASKLKDIGSRVASDTKSGQHWAKERNERKVLNQLIKRFNTTIERFDKGGTPGEQLMKRWDEQGILPDFTDGEDTIREKFSVIALDLMKIKKSSELSLRMKKEIDVSDLDEIDKEEKEHAINLVEKSLDPIKKAEIISKVRADKPHFSNRSDSEILGWAISKGIQ